MELEFNFDLFEDAPMRPIQEDVGWALLELSLDDPDYDSVSRELKKIPESPFSQRLSQKLQLRITHWS